jgi:hypothetical protein
LLSLYSDKFYYFKELIAFLTLQQGGIVSELSAEAVLLSGQAAVPLSGQSFTSGQSAVPFKGFTNLLLSAVCAVAVVLTKAIAMRSMKINFFILFLF